MGDPDRSISRAYGMLNPATGHNSRGIVTVDTAGDIIYRAVTDLSGGEPFKGTGARDRILKIFQEYIG